MIQYHEDGILPTLVSLLQPLRKKSPRGRHSVDKGGSVILPREGTARVSSFEKRHLHVLNGDISKSMSSQRLRQAAFHQAARSGHSDLVMAYLQSGGMDLEKTENGRSPLLSACTNGHKNVAKVLLSAGANVHACDPESFCCLHAAALGNFVALMDILLAHGADIEAVDHLMSTPLHAATLRAHVEAMKFLLHRGAYISPRTTEHHTPLLLCCSVGYEHPARVLLERGANPMDRTPSGNTCLLLAIANGYFGISEMLIAKGANPNHQGEKRIPVIHAASGAGSRRIVTALLKAGASTTSLDGINSGTALFNAAGSARPVATRLLLQAGALELARNGWGMRPMEVVGTMLSPEITGAPSVINGVVAVRQALLRGPAFRARSWVWPVALDDGDGAAATAPVVAMMAPVAAAVAAAAAAAAAPVAAAVAVGASSNGDGRKGDVEDGRGGGGDGGGGGGAGGGGGEGGGREGGEGGGRGGGGGGGGGAAGGAGAEAGAGATAAAAAAAGGCEEGVGAAVKTPGATAAVPVVRPCRRRKRWGENPFVFSAMCRYADKPYP